MVVVAVLAALVRCWGGRGVGSRCRGWAGRWGWRRTRSLLAGLDGRLWPGSRLLVWLEGGLRARGGFGVWLDGGLWACCGVGPVYRARVIRLEAGTLNGNGMDGVGLRGTRVRAVILR